MDAWALVASEIFPDQGSNSCSLPWQGHAYPLYHQGSTSRALFKCALHIATSFYRLQCGKWGSKKERSQGDSWGMLPWPDDELNFIVIIEMPLKASLSPIACSIPQMPARQPFPQAVLNRREQSGGAPMRPQGWRQET